MSAISSSYHQQRVRSIPSAVQRAFAAPVLHNLASWPSGLGRARSNTPYSPMEKAKYVIVSRTPTPLMPAAADPLHSTHGTTADPGLAADWFFPQRCSDTIRWLIVYVMLSRPRSLATLKSVNLTRQIRDIIEQGPPEDLVANFDRLFREKFDATRELAREAARAYGLLPEFF